MALVGTFVAVDGEVSEVVWLASFRDRRQPTLSNVSKDIDAPKLRHWSSSKFSVGQLALGSFELDTLEPRA